MEFVIVGLGVGALLALVGFVLREVAGSGEPGSSAASLGRFLMIAAAGVWVGTLVGLLVNPEGSLGWVLVGAGLLGGAAAAVLLPRLNTAKSPAVPVEPVQSREAPAGWPAPSSGREPLPTWNQEPVAPRTGGLLASLQPWLDEAEPETAPAPESREDDAPADDVVQVAELASVDAGAATDPVQPAPGNADPVVADLPDALALQEPAGEVPQPATVPSRSTSTLRAETLAAWSAAKPSAQPVDGTPAAAVPPSSPEVTEPLRPPGTLVDFTSPILSGVTIDDIQDGRFASALLNDLDPLPAWHAKPAAPPVADDDDEPELPPWAPPPGS